MEGEPEWEGEWGLGGYTVEEGTEAGEHVA